MAYNYKTDRFAAIGAALDELEKEAGYHYALLIDDNGGLHISENCESIEQAFELLCLFSVRVMGEIIEKLGPGAAEEYMARLFTGINGLLLEEIADG